MFTLQPCCGRQAAADRELALVDEELLSREIAGAPDEISSCDEHGTGRSSALAIVSPLHQATEPNSRGKVEHWLNSSVPLPPPVGSGGDRGAAAGLGVDGRPVSRRGGDRPATRGESLVEEEMSSMLSSRHGLHGASRKGHALQLEGGRQAGGSRRGHRGNSRQGGGMSYSSISGLPAIDGSPGIGETSSPHLRDSINNNSPAVGLVGASIHGSGADLHDHFQLDTSAWPSDWSSSWLVSGKEGGGKGGGGRSERTPKLGPVTSSIKHSLDRGHRDVRASGMTPNPGRPGSRPGGSRPSSKAGGGLGELGDRPNSSSVRYKLAGINSAQHIYGSGMDQSRRKMDTHDHRRARRVHTEHDPPRMSAHNNMLDSSLSRGPGSSNLGTVRRTANTDGRTSRPHTRGESLVDEELVGIGNGLSRPLQLSRGGARTMGSRSMNLSQGCSSRPGTRGESLVEEELNHVRDSAWPPGASMLGRSSTSNRDANSRPGTRDGRDGRPVTRDGRPGTREGRAFGESVGEGLGEEIKLSELSGHLAKVYEELCLPETPPNERRASGIMQRLDEDFVFD